MIGRHRGQCWTGAVLTLLFLLGGRSTANAIPLGILSFDTLIPDGVNAFNIGNFTGAFSLPTDFPVVDPVTFLASSLSLTHEDGSTTIFLGDIGPGFVDNPDLLSADSIHFLSATFTATLSSLEFLLDDGSTFQAASSLVTLVLSPTIGPFLSAGDFVVIDIEPAGATPVPEPGTLTLLGGAIAAWTVRRRYVKRS